MKIGKGRKKILISDLKVDNDVSDAEMPALVVLWLLEHWYRNDILHRVRLHSSKALPRSRNPSHKLGVLSIRVMAGTNSRVHMQDGSWPEH